MRTLILLLVVTGACSRSEAPDKQNLEPPAEEAAKTAADAPADQPSGAPPSDEAQQAAEETAPAVNLDAPPTVELLDAGKRPRKKLGTTFEPGAQQTLQVTSTSKIVTTYGPLLKAESALPSFVYQLETEAKETKAGTTRFDLRVTEVAVDSSKKAADSLEGVTGSFSINARGMVEAFAIDTPSDASLLVHDRIDQIKRAVRLASLPLPEEPVGKGAKWTATQVIEQRTAQVQQISTFELLGVKGEQVRAKITYDAAAPKQTITMPGSGTPFKLDQLHFEGQGEGTWQLVQLAPSSASEQTIAGFMMASTAPRPEAVLMSMNTTIEVKAMH